MRIAQLVPALHHGDAIGNNVLALRDHFRASGMESAVFYIDADEGMVSQGFHYTRYEAWIAADASTITILHYALPSLLNDLWRNASGLKVLVYHNITPPEFLRGYPHLQHISRAGRHELKKLSEVSAIALADSEYNRRELVEMGFQSPQEMPIFIDYSAYESAPCPVTIKMYQQASITNFLFVGRVTPNKCQHDIIRFYGFYKRYVDPRCRLFLVGKYQGFDDYLWKCSRFADALRLGDVHFTGRVTHRELLAYYHLADLFVSMSEHEGFGVPLLEAMHLDIPIMGYAAAAVPFTLGAGGVKFATKNAWLELAELAGILIHDETVRNQVIESQRRRMTYFSRSAISARWDRLVGGR